EVLLEDGPDGVGELAEAHADGDDADTDRRQMAERIAEDRGDRLLRTVVRSRRAAACDQVQREQHDGEVGDPAPRKPQALGDADRVVAATQRIEDGADEAPDRVRAQPDHDREQEELAGRPAGEDDEAARLIRGHASDSERQAERAPPAPAPGSGLRIWGMDGPRGRGPRPSHNPGSGGEGRFAGWPSWRGGRPRTVPPAPRRSARPTT